MSTVIDPNPDTNDPTVPEYADHAKWFMANFKSKVKALEDEEATCTWCREEAESRELPPRICPLHRRKREALAFYS